MKKKLTLIIKDSTIKRAKAYAAHSNESLSQLVENYLKMLTANALDKSKLSPKLSRIAGVVKLPDDFDEKRELEARFLRF